MRRIGVIAANKDPCDVAGAFNQHRTATLFSWLPIIGSFGAERSSMTGTISGLAGTIVAIRGGDQLDPAYLCPS